MRRDAALFEGGHAPGDFGAYLAGEGVAVDELGGHGAGMVLKTVRIAAAVAAT
jgi:hypothetical protein